MYDCPQCGLPTLEFDQGYCRECAAENQRILDSHNAQLDWWRSLSDYDKQQAIKYMHQ